MGCIKVCSLAPFFPRVSVMLHLAQGCQGVMNDLGLHNSDFRGGKEMNEVWLRLQWSRGGLGRVLAHLFKERNSFKENVLHRLRFIRQKEVSSCCPKFTIYCFLPEYLSTAPLCELGKWEEVSGEMKNRVLHCWFGGEKFLSCFSPPLKLWSFSSPGSDTARQSLTKCQSNG